MDKKDTAIAIMERLEKSGHKSYIIGGAVRDLIMGYEPNDYDIFTSASGDELKEMFPECSVIGGAERQEKILTVVVDDTEVSTFRSSPDRTETGVSLRDHLGTCDFTINAIAMDKDGILLDASGGLFDLQNSIVRAVGKPQDRIREDVLRALRAVRFALKYRFTIEEELVEVIRSTSLSVLPIERVREEFMKILAYREGPRMLRELGLLQQIIPEFEYLAVDGGPYHAENIDEHSLMCFELLSLHSDDKTLKLAALLHDIGKPYCAKVKPGADHINFIHHDREGAEITKSIMERMKYSTEEIRMVTCLIRNHQFPLDGGKTCKAYLNMWEDQEDSGVSPEDQHLLRYCDNQANMKRLRMSYHDFLKLWHMPHFYYMAKASNTALRVKDLKFGGKDLIAMGLTPSKDFGVFLHVALNEVKERKVENEYEALKVLAIEWFGQREPR